MTEIKGRLAAATPAPWARKGDHIHAKGEPIVNMVRLYPPSTPDATTPDATTPDAILIAAAPFDLSWLIAYVERLEDVESSSAAVMETANVECRGDEDCDHCVHLQAHSTLDKFRSKARR